ncbi:uncharacterized protein LOC130713254 [Lotus japonicus]|uniref:uncharacterized protein LOC130713254 n=1 Tax=Lotus japonicus TaxID=34305 RepID=UPI002590EB42|nr:uncharacterized protein LOC130713254 [Lotus japonicus]
METHVQFDRVKKFWENLGFLPVNIVEAHGHSGGLWCLALSHILPCIHVVDVFEQAITVEVRVSQSPWICTGVYASPIPASRVACWRYLATLRQRINYPWMIIGDFNDSLLSSDQRGGVFSHARANLFAAMLQDCGLIPLHTIGLRFSWVRRRGGVPVMHKKLDWCLGDSDWNFRFPDALAENLTRVHSDHSPVLVRCGGSPPFRGSRPFRFEAAWLSHADYEQVVASAWSPQETLPGNLHLVQERSMVFNKDVFGDIRRRKRTLHARIRGIQLRLDTVDSAALSLLHDKLQIELHHTLAQEELLWFQKSREQEALLGGRNTRYFHTKTIVHRRRNKIISLTLPSGEVCTDEQTLQVEALRFFKGLFCSPLASRPLQEGKYFCPSLSHEHVSQLSAEVSPQEVWRAVSTMGSFKAPGPDGFQAIFFKSCWHIVGGSVYAVVRDAFITGTFDRALSDMLVALIPKVDVPASFRELRPISLCNVMYKLITKVLVLRLRPCLQEIVGPLQSSFIAGRGTSDNAIILQEVAYFMMNKKRRSRNVIFKLDLEKAYDQVSWQFLEKTLVEFGFPSSIVALIMYCVTSSSISLLWNGNRLPAFSATRGLRQGDPLSSYLFVLCMERLAHMINHEVRQGQWKPVQISQGGPGISHLFFADDVLLFAKAEVAQVRNIYRVLEDFCGASGLKINLSKSKAMASWCVDGAVKDRIAAITSIPFTNNIGKYLGFPIHIGRVRKEDFSFIVDRVSARLATWKASLLNKPARVTLAKSVLSAIPVYVMQLNWLPQSVCDQLDMVVRRFIWGNAHSKGIPLVAWDKVARPKKYGGLGLRSARLNNVAMLGKQLWGLVQQDEKFWVRVVRGQHVAGGEVLSCAASAGSYFWRSIIKARDMLKGGFQVRFGDGSSSFWYSCWTPFGLLCDIVPVVDIHDIDLTVRDVFSEGSFNSSLLYTELPPEVNQFLFTFKHVFFDSGTRDCLIWAHNMNGNYTVKDGFQWLLHQEEVDVDSGPVGGLWNVVWKVNAPENIRVFLWLVLHDALPTRCLLLRRSLATPALCPRCGVGDESILHCLRDCADARRVWRGTGFILPQAFYAVQNFGEVLRIFDGFGLHIVLATAWVIWKERCRFVFASQHLVVHKVVREARELWLLIADTYHRGATSPTVRWVRWQPPRENFVALNTDGSSLGNPGAAGIGGVVRSEHGNWLLGYAGSIGEADSLLAELVSILRGLEVCWDHGYRQVDLFSDSLLALGLIMDLHPVFHRYAAIIGRIKTLLQRSWQVRCQHILREGNSVADFLAKYGASAQSAFLVWASPLQSLVPMLRADQVGTEFMRI